MRSTRAGPRLARPGSRLLPGGRRGAGVRELDAGDARGARRRSSGASPKLWHYAMSLLHGPPPQRGRRHGLGAAGQLRPVGGGAAAAGHGPRHPQRADAARRATCSSSTGTSEGASSRYFDRVRELSRRVAHELGGDFLDNPIWYDNRVITVHSLGGCRMGRQRARGRRRRVRQRVRVPGAAHRRRLGDARTGRGQPVADDRGAGGPLCRRDPGAAAPRGLADRLGDRGAGAGGRPTPAGAHAVSLSFTEEMKGYVTLGESDYDRGYRAGKKAEQRLHVPPDDHGR